MAITSTGLDASIYAEPVTNTAVEDKTSLSTDDFMTLLLVELKPNETVQDYLNEGKIAIVKFATTTCPPCKMLKPIFEKVSSK